MKSVDEHLKWLDEMLIPTLGNNLPDGHTLEVTTTDRLHGRVYEVAISKPDEDLRALRRITISELLDQPNLHVNISTVELSNYEGIAPIEYRIKDHFGYHFYGNDNDFTRLHGFVFQTARSPLKASNTPSRDLCKKVEDFNAKWLGKDHYVAPYRDSWEYGDDWRLKLCHRNGQIYTHHISPDEVSGHLLRLMASMYEEAFNAGRREGAVQAFEAIATENLRVIQQKLSISDYNLPQRARNFLDKEQLS